MDHEKNTNRNNPQGTGSGNDTGNSFFDSLLNDIQNANIKIKDYENRVGINKPAEPEETARLAAEEVARAAAEKAKAEENARQAAIEKAQQEAKERLAEIEAKKKAEEAARAAAEKAKAEEAARAAAEKAKAEENARQAAIEKAQREANERLAEIEAEKKAARIAAEEEKARREAVEKAKAEEARRLAAEEKARAEEAERLAALEEEAEEDEEPAYAALNFTDPSAAASAAIAMKLAGVGEADEEHDQPIIDPEFEQSSYRSLTGEEEARQMAEKAEAERLAAEKAAAERAEAERLAAEKAAAEKAEAERLAAEKAVAERVEAERLAAEKAAAKKAEAERLAAEKAAAEKAEAERLAAEKAAAKKAEAERLAAEKAAAERNAAIAKAKAAEAERVAALEQAKAEEAERQAALEKAAAEPKTTNTQKAARENVSAGQAGKNTAKATSDSAHKGSSSGRNERRPASGAAASAARSSAGAGRSASGSGTKGRPEKPHSENKQHRKVRADNWERDTSDAPENSRSVGRIISIIHFALSILTVILLLIANVLPVPILLAVAVALAAIWLLTRLFRTERSGRFRRTLGSALSIFMCAVLILSSITLLRLNVTLKSITGVNSQIATFGVYALADDTAETVKDVKDDIFGTLDAQSRAMTDDTIGQINTEVGKSIETANYTDGSALANALIQGECRTIIMNENFMDVITETDGFSDFETKTKEIASYTCTSMLESKMEQSHSPDVITLYITGIDTYGDISTTSRSDVNIIAVANTRTKQVLLVSTPRDYYVPLSISNGVPDKLTHAGIYGVNVSMDTLAMLYGIDIDYYFRINFDGFKDVIDALGGVEVWSDYEFTALHGSDCHFVKGYNTVNGEQALAFARERYSFAAGDRQRGKNQMAVIQAVIKKLQTPAVLNNYSELLRGLEGSFETNLPSTKIISVVKQQLADPGSWNVVQYSVDGTGDMNTTYSMNQRLYVMIPDQSTVDTAKRMIELVDNGGVITSQQ